MDKDDVIATLNDLIETSRDGEEGFRTCADGVKSSQLKQIFQQAASRCAQAVLALASGIVCHCRFETASGPPQASGTT